MSEPYIPSLVGRERERAEATSWMIGLLAWASGELDKQIVRAGAVKRRGKRRTRLWREAQATAIAIEEKLAQWTPSNGPN